MAQPKHILNGIDPKAEAPLLMENLRELSDQMTLENLAGKRLKIANPSGGYITFGQIDDTRFGLLLNDGTNDRVFIGFEE
jgi:hypothetical protein